MKISSAAFYYGVSKYPVSENNLKKFFPETFVDSPEVRAKIEKALSVLCGGHHVKINEVNYGEGYIYLQCGGAEVIYGTVRGLTEEEKALLK